MFPTKAKALLVLAVLVCGAAARLPAQSVSDPLPAFDVASVKPNNTEEQIHSNIPLGPGDVYNSNGGHFTAIGFPLITYIVFAYRITGAQAQSLPSQLPGWVSTERFDIDARTDGDPAKDSKNQMRLMMRSLLTDRFGMVVHFETKQARVFGLALVKPGKTGPWLQAHPDGTPCPTTFPIAGSPPPTAIEDEKFPAICGGFLGMTPSAVGRTRLGARNITMSFIASGVSNFGDLGRPVVDQTGLTGNFDMSLEWVPGANGAGGGADLQSDPSGPTFLEAVKEQLGLRLDSQTGSTEVLVVDHIERPSGN